MKVAFSITCLFLFAMPVLYGDSLNTHCDTNLNPENTSRGYHARTIDRCEGFYESKVSSGSLNIVGVTHGKFKFEFSAKEIVTLSSPIVTEKVVNVQAVGIPLKTYYRMDATIQPNASLIWPVGKTLYPQKLKYKKVGAYGWIGDKNNKTYVPINVASAMLSTAPDNTIYVYLRASIDVMNVKWRFANVKQDGSCSKSGEWIRPNKTSYKSGRRIVSRVPPDRRGEICLTVRAESQEGDESIDNRARIILN